jgi:hypothetical protein
MDNKEGLYNKYHISKSDGSECDPDAKYFVLRYDKLDANGKAARVALKAYAMLCPSSDLCMDLTEAIRQIES